MKITNRANLAKYFKDLGFKVGAEVGVDEGAYSAILCQQIPQLRLYCIDIWDLGAGGNRQIRSRAYEQAKKTLSAYNATLIRQDSIIALSDIDDNTLDFVYIDAGHRFDEVIKDIIGWTKKVKKGGIVAGHDYTPTSIEVVLAVDAYTNGHVLPLQATTDQNESPSWWFKKVWNI